MPRKRMNYVAMSIGGDRLKIQWPERPNENDINHTLWVEVRTALNKWLAASRAMQKATPTPEPRRE